MPQLINTSPADQVQGTILSKCIPETSFTPFQVGESPEETDRGENRGKGGRNYYLATIEHPTVYKNGVCACVCVYWLSPETMSPEEKLKEWELSGQQKTTFKGGYANSTLSVIWTGGWLSQRQCSLVCHFPSLDLNTLLLILFTSNKKGPYEIPGSQLLLQLESHKKLEEKNKQKRKTDPGTPLQVRISSGGKQALVSSYLPGHANACSVGSGQAQA